MATKCLRSGLLRAGALMALALLLGNYAYKRLLLPQQLVMEGNSVPAYRQVARTFKELVESRAELGASLAVYEAGQPALQIVAGHRDLEYQLPWTEDTLAFGMSISKAVCALCVARLVDDGLVDYERPVSSYWPEFGRANKHNITVRQLLSHQAGLVALRRPIQLAELAANDSSIAEVLANQEPRLPVGTIGYHGMTYGLYVDQLVRRADPKGRSVAEFFQDEFARPAGVEAYVGLSRHQFYRLARAYLSLTWNLVSLLVTADTTALNMYLRALFTRIGRDASFSVLGDDIYVKKLNDPDVAALPFASVNLVSSAPSLARLFSLFANNGSVGGRQLLTSQLVRLLSDGQQAATTSSDAVNGLAWSCNRGFTIATSPLGSTMVGHLGFGGQMVWSDPQHGVTIAYLTNHLRMCSSHRDSTHRQLLEAVYSVVAARRRQ